MSETIRGLLPDGTLPTPAVAQIGGIATAAAQPHVAAAQAAAAAAEAASTAAAAVVEQDSLQYVDPGEGAYGSESYRAVAFVGYGYRQTMPRGATFDTVTLWIAQIVNESVDVRVYESDSPPTHPSNWNWDGNATHTLLGSTTIPAGTLPIVGDGLPAPAVPRPTTVAFPKLIRITPGRTMHVVFRQATQGALVHRQWRATDPRWSTLPEAPHLHGWLAMTTPTTAGSVLDHLRSVPLRLGTRSLYDVWETLGESDDGRLPRLHLAPQVHALVGDTLQVFTAAVVEHPDPGTVPFTFAAAQGAAYPRYYELTPTTTSNVTLTARLEHLDGTVASERTATVVVKAPPANPPAIRRIMPIGDSITAGGAWVTEARRRLTGSGGTPAGLGLSNVRFVGDKPIAGTDGEGYFGRSGWSLANWVGATPYPGGIITPFWNPDTSAFSVKYWIDTHGDGLAPDIIPILLGWNGMPVGEAGTPAAHAVNRGHWITLLDTIQAEYPTAKVLALGIQMPSMTGGTGADYGASGAYGDAWRLRRKAAGYNLMLQEVASGYPMATFVDIAAQFDHIHNMPATDHPVNVRSATTERRGSNGVHPSLEGYMQIADAVFRAIAHQL